MLETGKNRATFYEIAIANIKRTGINELLQYLDSTDFFIAPCSKAHHLAERGGLCLHSLNVYNAILTICAAFDIDINDAKILETITIISLFHDVCKTNFYKQEMKNVKKNNQWVQEPQYVIDDRFPIGHGEKSVIEILRCMPLTNEEILAIRWHMNGFDSAVKGGDYSLSNAQTKSVFVTLLQIADMTATFILEK